MAKVLEGPGMGLMKKWGINVPNYVVVTSVDELTKLGQANEWLKKSKLVAKAHEALGSRFKLGLVKVGLDFKAAEAATKEMIGRQVGSITVTQVIVSEMIPHKEEYYCAVKSTREGSVIRVPRRDALRARLESIGVGTEIYYPVPFHMQECFAPLGYKPGAFPHAERAAAETLALPIYGELSEGQQAHVVESIAAFYGA